ncbi:SDR family oxidoreductase [Propionivibrio sp.]|uniref:SDR family NAD(P)-dependent oxidoreductase n=1 Tax=Propionivibrio sp. TaxID=2212460 RepID=UPI0026019CF3|nr:SDR family oxidoreductase [Propionivibrio sp.]
MNKKYVLILGASSSIGCELIRQLSDEETIILAHYYSEKERLEDLQVDSKGRLVLIQADLSHEPGIESLIELVTKECRCPNKIVFLAAPRLYLTRFKDLTREDFKRQIDMPLNTAFSILNRYLPEMASDKYGKIVFMLSSYTLGKPPSAMAHYVTAKYALLGLMKALACEYAGKNICINAVSPSMIETDFLSDIPEKIVELTAQQHPRKRNGQPADVAPVIKFLLSDDASYLTGVNIPVTGGI